MKTFVVLAAGALVTIASAPAAKATFVITSMLSAPASDPSFQSVDLSGQAGNNGTNFGTSAYTVGFSGVGNDQGVVNGSDGNHAAPITGNGTPTTSNYFSTGTGLIYVKFAVPQTSVALLWGSVDTSNQLIFADANGHSVGSVFGSDITTMANGFQGYGGSFYTEITSNTAFDYLVFTSGTISFEASNVEFSQQALLPEPATYAVFGMGLLGLTLARRRRA